MLAVAGIPTTADVEAAALPCSKPAARRAITSTTFAARIRSQLGASFFYPNRTVLDLFGVSTVVCRDLTGDGRAEMVVHLQCCTVSSPSPWGIFRKQNGRWTLAYSRINVTVFSIRVARFTEFADGTSKIAVEERRPDYAASDPNCCPSGYAYRYIYWNGARFVADPG